MIQPTEQAIRDRAYAIWEREGRPHGRERDNWLQAAWELSGEEAKAAARKTAKSSPKTGSTPAAKTGRSAVKRARATK